MPSDRDRERIIYSEGREVCRIYVADVSVGYGAWTARLDTPDGEAWTRGGDTEEEAVLDLILALGDEITGINRLLAAIAAYRKGEEEI